MRSIFLIIIIIFILLVLKNFIPSKENGNLEKRKNYLNLNHFQIVEYYTSENQQIAISKSKANSSFEYYKVFIDPKIKKSIREEKYINGNLVFYKILKYNHKNEITSISIYNNRYQIISEEVISYENSLKSTTIKFQYKYYPKENNESFEKLELKKQFKNNIPHGRWTYYTIDGQEIKELLYEDGFLKKEWIYEYDNENKKITIDTKAKESLPQIPQKNTNTK